MNTIEPLLRFAITGLENVANHISRLPDTDAPSEELLIKAARKVFEAQELLETWGSWTGVAQR